MSDSDLIAFDDLYLRSLSRAKPSTCAATWTMGIAAGFVPLGTEMDSTLAVEWVSLVEKWVWIGVRRVPLGRAATPADVQAVLGEYFSGAPPQEREHARRVLLHQTTDSIEICNFVKGLFGRIRRMPTATAGPVLRAMMFGPTHPT